MAENEVEDEKNGKNRQFTEFINRWVNTALMKNADRLRAR